jgi:protein-S-isoprenylcysteine O-methyltransferase Ste14
MSKLELRIPPVALVVAFALAMGLLARSIPAATVVQWPWWVPFITVLAGFLFGLAGVVEFRRVRTTVNPTTPQASSSVVTTGVYRWSRNPMYVGLLMILAGWALYLGNLCAALLLPLFVVYMNRYQIAPEERALSHKFGSEYLHYARRVRRWL